MDSWSAVTNIDFLEACNSNDADIRISWETGSHGDGTPFDGSICDTPEDNQLAHAFYPGTNANVGDLHFDDDEEWSTSGSSACDDIDVETIALHELGHVLGLRHSFLSDVMTVGHELQRNLGSDDRSGIRFIYGSRGNAIRGLGVMCKNSSYDFSVPCLPNNINITWNVTSNLQITSGQGTEEVTIKATASGIGELSATISTGCDNIQFFRNIEVVDGIPNYTQLDATDDSDTRNLLSCQITDAEASYSGTSSILEYEWDFPNSNDWYVDGVASPFTPYETVEIDYFESPAPSTEKIHIRARNICGWSWWKETTWSVTDLCGARTTKDSASIDDNPKDKTPIEEPLSLSLYPTVTNHEINLRWDNNLSGKKYDFKIYNNQGLLIKTFKNLKYNRQKLSVGDLPSGIYFARIDEGFASHNEKFVIIR